MAEISRNQGMPLVSVIMPAYNRDLFLKRALDSVLVQTYPAFEIVVVDDASTDGTEALMAALCPQDPRIRYHRHPVNKGAQAARNTGIRAAKGHLIAFLDSDNEWLPDKLDKQVRLFSQGDARLGVVYAGYREMFSNGEHVDRLPSLRGDIHKTALKRWVCDTNTIVVKKDILEEEGLLNETIRAYQEWDLCINLARYGTFDYVPEPLAVYHHHHAPTISKDRMLSAMGFLDVVEAHREEILNRCGRYTLSRHYMSVGHHFMLADRSSTGRAYFIKAWRTAPYNLQTLVFLGLSLLSPGQYEWLHRTKKELSGKRP